MTGVTCTCEGPSGFTNLGDSIENQWWVHASCGLPTKPWLEAQDDDMLNFFRGGPLDGTAYSTNQLLSVPINTHPEFAASIAEYRWTPEVVISPKTGASARVWLHQSIAPAPAPPRTPVKKVAGGQPIPAPAQEGTDNMAPKKSAAVPPPPPVAVDEDLHARRVAGGFSRNQVAEAAGLTSPKIGRIEKGGGRTTPEEMAQVAAALAKLEANAG
jgi:hypothetical protein